MNTNNGRSYQIRVDSSGAAQSVVPSAAREVPFSDRDWGRAASRVKHAGASKQIEGAVSTGIENTLREASQVPDDKTLKVVVELEESPFNFRQLATKTKDERNTAIQTRKENLRPIQARASAAIRSAGGVVGPKMWLVNNIFVEIPAGDVGKLAQIPQVKDVHIDNQTPRQDYTGTEIRNAILSQDFRDAGFKGETRSRTSTPNNDIKIAVIDIDAINTHHFGWYDTQYQNNKRIGGVWGCFYLSYLEEDQYCEEWTDWSLYDDETHATRVAWVAVGSLQQGQDPNNTNSYLQDLESGVSADAQVYSFITLSTGGTMKALEQAVEEGVDVAVTSLTITCPGDTICVQGYDCYGYNSAIKNALLAGTLPVYSSGNNGVDPPFKSAACSANWPGWRTEAINVGGLYTPYGEDYENSVVSNQDAGHDYTSSYGSIDIDTLSGVSDTTPAVDIVAPSYIGGYFTDGQTGTSLTERSGTSYAAPAVGAAAGQLREIMNLIGWDGDDARALMVNLLLQGDGYRGLFSSVRDEVTPDSGYGRLRLHGPKGFSMDAPWGWGYRDFVLTEGNKKTYTVGDSGPEGSNINVWKWAILWYEDDFSAVSDVGLKVFNTCPAGGGNPVLVDQDLSWNLRKSVILTDQEIHGKCLEMHVIAYDTPPGGVRIWSADYFAGASNRDEHVAPSL